MTVLFLLAALCTSTSTGPDRTASDLEGLWHAMPFVGSGYAELYALFENSSFLWRESSMDGESRLRERSGSWRVEGDSLVLLVSTDLVWEGGSLVPATGSVGTDSELIGFTPMYYDYFIPEEVRLQVGRPSLVQAGDNPDLPVSVWRMLIAGEEYWLLSADPGTMTEILGR